jgi:hypothetical protein
MSDTLILSRAKDLEIEEVAPEMAILRFAPSMR